MNQILLTEINTQISKPQLSQDSKLIQYDEEENLQDAYENRNYYKKLNPEDFSLDRSWWYRCSYCGGQTRVHTRHPYCKHCGFSPKTTIQKKG